MPTREHITESITGNVRNHIQTYLETNGEDGHIYRGNPTLLLITRGRKSGLLRRQALIYGIDGERYVVVASNRGAPRFPAWYLNLKDTPDAHIQVADEQFTAIAREVAGEERQRLWELMIGVYPSFLRYQEKTERIFPIIVFERAS